ncbi:hypothetical protein [Klebsiella pneumoniae]|uniref:hypothetical protein n=1 Tax=Klebsiella pneumoniae TaxID=573 RepID=UPI0007CC6450|nr:hypothetical protein [Klebsiella pneumoniae]SAV16659.1 Uncharacterised protein [Klebsiella pneumoniae]
MPFVTFKTNLRLSAAQRNSLKAVMGKLTELIPGKNERSLLLEIQDNTLFFYQGDDSTPMAFISIAVFNNRYQKGYAELGSALSGTINNALHIAPEHIFIQYDNIDCFSVAGKTYVSEAN